MRALTAFGPLALATVVGACTTFGSDDPPPGNADGGAGGVDGALLDAALVGDPPAPDAEARRCSVIVDDDFSRPNPVTWKLTGEAKFESGRLTLTPDKPTIAGGAWVAVSSAAAGFKVTFDSELGNGPSPADGIAVAWSLHDGTTPPALGGIGSETGICHSADEVLGIFFDEFHGQIVTRDSQNPDCGSQGVVLGAWVAGLTNTGLSVSLAKGTVTTTVGSKSFSFAPKAFDVRWIGLLAGTGSNSTLHALTHATIERCD